MQNHPDISAGSLPPLPPGYGVLGGEHSVPLPSPQVRVVPPLPPGYAMAR